MAEVPTKVAVLAPVEAQVAVSVEAQVGDGRGADQGRCAWRWCWTFNSMEIYFPRAHCSRSAPLSRGMTAGPIARYNQSTLPPCAGDEVGDGVGALGVQSFIRVVILKEPVRNYGIEGCSLHCR